MSSTTTATAAPPVPPATTPSTPAVPPAPSLRQRLRAGVAGTPGTLRVTGVTVAVFAILFGILGSYAVGERSAGIEQARDEAAQIVRLQEVRTNLVAADAAATNAFLVGGLEPTAARESYEDGIETASRTLAAAAAESDGSDPEALAEVNQGIATYTGLVEAARANNRQGFPVGVAYLKQASTLLRDEALPRLRDVTAASAGRVDDGYDRSESSGALLLGTACLTILAALCAQAVLFVRTRRVFSIPLTAAIGVVVLASFLAAAGMAYAQSKASDVRNGPYAQALGLSQARIDGFDAKSAESLTLISRGSGEVFETRFVEKAEAATTSLRNLRETPAIDELTAYLAVHGQVRALEEAGDWDGAVALATGSDPNGSNATFAAFDATSGDQLAAEAETLRDELAEARAPLGILRLALLVAGLVAAALAWQAFAIRLREYR